MSNLNSEPPFSVRPPDAAKSTDDAARLHLQPGRQRGALRAVRRPRVMDDEGRLQDRTLLFENVGPVISLIPNEATQFRTTILSEHQIPFFAPCTPFKSCRYDNLTSIAVDIC